MAAEQGYHVIGLTYPAAPANSCQDDLNCYGNAFREGVTGEENPDSNKTTVGDHPQDSIVNRLVSVLKWARNNQNAGDGWEVYLTPSDGVDWTQVHLAGFSNGSSHASFMGTLPEFQSIRRVALFAGPNDGHGNSAEAWDPASYIQRIEGVTDTRYYGLVHRLNNAHGYSDSDNVLFKVTKNWETFGMAGVSEFYPAVGETHDFGTAHMLISLDPPPTDTDEDGTTFRDAHNSVVKGKYCPEYGGDNDSCQIDDDEQVEIGYEPAWACILGSGDRYASQQPDADAGPDQTVECQGNGGANVDLDGSDSSDADCDILSYAWSGPFGTVGGRNPNVFCPLGTSPVWLVTSDIWLSSLLDTTQITVADTQPPLLTVTLTPTLLWVPDHRLVRIDATVNVADTCGGTPPSVLLTSITSNQPDNGVADGDTINDIQDAQIDTFDQSFLLRSQRAGNDPNGRTYTITYTATDASGNQTQTTATVHVPHSQ